MRRIKADAYTHVHGKPLKVLDGEDPFQRSFDCFGKTYRDRLTEVEREVAWQRRRFVHARMNLESQRAELDALLGRTR